MPPAAITPKTDLEVGGRVASVAALEGRDRPGGASTAAAPDADPSTSAAARASGSQKCMKGTGGGGDAGATPAPATIRNRRHCRPACATMFSRPNTWDFKTRKAEWAARHTFWRYLHGTFFFIGPPDHLLREIWPPLLFNMSVALLVAADFVLSSTTPPPGDHAMRSGFLVDRLPTNLGNIESLTRMMLLAVSLLATWRVNRVYERWWAARQAFAILGTVAVSLTQRAHAWVGDPAIRASIARWSVVYHYSILQMCRFDDGLHPDGAALLQPDELALYNATRKPRQLVTLRLTVDIGRAGPGGGPLPSTQALVMDELVSKASAAAGAVGAIRFSPMPDGLCSLSTGFAQSFLLMLPLSWWAAPPPDLPEAALLPSAMVSALLSLTLYLALNLLFLGALAAADKLEAPFDRLPLLDMVDTTRRDVERVREQVAGLEGLAENKRGEGGGAGP